MDMPQPESQYAIQALQEEVIRLRAALSQSEDTRVYLSAMLIQSRAELSAVQAPPNGKAKDITVAP